MEASWSGSFGGAMECGWTIGSDFCTDEGESEWFCVNPFDVIEMPSILAKVTVLLPAGLKSIREILPPDSAA